MANSTSQSLSSGRLLDERFLLERPLGRGAQSVVWLARDLGRCGAGAAEEVETVLRAPQVAVKVLRPRQAGRHGESQARPSDLLRVRHEAAALSALGHPAIIELLHAGIDQGLVYLALEFCPGESLESLVRRKTRVDPLQATRWASELCSALALAHDRGILHRDIKPANILVQGKQVKLLDFGMARVRGMHADVDRGVILGTLPYMPLEAWGLQGAGVDGRTDLYGLAATLYEVLTGARAFPGADAAAILESHRRGTPRDPCELNPSLPRPLADVLLRALARDPRDRYQTASGLAADLEQVQARRDSRPFPLGTSDFVTRPVVPRLVGRQQERQQCFELFDRARAGQGSLVLLESPAGGGRSRFAEEVCEALRTRGGLVIAGRCHSFEHSLPYDPAVQLLAHFRTQLSLLPQPERRARVAQLDQSLAGRTHRIVDLVPTLGDTLTCGSGKTPTQQSSSQASFVATVRDAILGTATKGHPTVVLLDDVHRADAATRTLLLDLARAVAGRPVLLLFTAVQSEELSSLGTVSPTTSLDGEAEDFLVALGAAAGSSLTAMELKPLRVAQTTELIGSMLGVLYDEARELADWIAGIAGGNPLRVVQLVRWLEQTGAITRSPEGWQLSMERVRQSELPEDLVDTIRVAVTGLEDPTRRVLAAAALLGSAFRTDQLARVLEILDFPSDDVLRALDRGERRGLLRPATLGPGQRPAWRFPHELMRRELAQCWPMERRPQLHAAAAQVLRGGRRIEELDDVRRFAVARHALGSPDPTEAVDLALSAGSRALKTFASQTALKLFSVAARAARSDSQRRRALLGRARALLQLDRPRKAIRPLSQALLLSTDELDRAEALLSRAEAYSIVSELRRTERDLKEAARLVGEGWPRSRSSMLVCVLREVLFQKLSLRSSSASQPVPRREALRCQVLQVAGRVTWFRRPELGLYFTVRGLRVALRNGARDEAARAAAALALMLACGFGRHEHAARKIAEARRLAGPSGSAELLARLQGYEGMCDFFAGAGVGAVSKLRSSIRTMTELGEFQDRRLFTAVLGLAKRDLGDVGGFRRTMTELFDSSVERGGDTQGEAWASFGLAWDACLHGDLRRALDYAGPAIETAEAQGDWHFAVAARGRRAQIHAAAGMRDAAARDLSEVRRLVSRRRLRGWFAAEGLICAAHAAVQLREHELAEELLPSRSALRGFGALLRLRDAVAGRLELAFGRSDEALRRAASALQFAELRLDAAAAWADLYRASGAIADRQTSERILSGCSGVARTEVYREVSSPAAEERLKQAAERLQKRLLRASLSGPRSTRIHDPEVVCHSTLECVSSQENSALITTFMTEPPTSLTGSLITPG